MRARTSGSAFLVTKPLQFLISQSILSQLALEEECTLLIVDGFSNSSEFSERVSQCDLGWRHVKWFATKKQAFNFLRKAKFSKVFVDSDVGFQNLMSLLNIRSKNQHLKIFVYEEGIGSYRDDLYKGFRKKVLDFIGAGTNFGGCVLTSGIYLIEPEKFLKKFPNHFNRCKKIEKNVSEIIELNISKFTYLFGINDLLCTIASNAMSEQCVIYFSSWQVDISTVERLLSDSDDKYIKLHPHLKDQKLDFAGGEEFFCLPSNIPAEIIVPALCQVYEKVSIYHHNSSLELYVSKSTNVNIVSV